MNGKRVNGTGSVGKKECRRRGAWEKGSIRRRESNATEIYNNGSDDL